MSFIVATETPPKMCVCVYQQICNSPRIYLIITSQPECLNVAASRASTKAIFAMRAFTTVQEKRLSAREVVISANYNDYISFLEYAIWNFLWATERFVSVPSLFRSFLCLIEGCFILSEIWFKIYRSEMYRFRADMACYVTNKRQLLIVWLLCLKWKLRKWWKCGSLIRVCIRNFQLEIWNQHKPQNSHYYSHLNGNWSASVHEKWARSMQNYQSSICTHTHANKQTNTHSTFTSVSFSNTHTSTPLHTSC